MFDFPTLPFSQAQAAEEGERERRISFTAYENQDEKQLYTVLDKQLRRLENKEDIDEKQLIKLEQAAAEFMIAIEEKEDIYQRIYWLRMLFQAQEKLNTLQTKEEVSSLQFSLSEVQASPFKTKLMLELDQRAQVLPTEVRSLKDQLMEKAFEQAGDDFINLGKMGRAFVIERLLAEGAWSVEAIQEETKRLNELLASLRQTTDLDVFRSKIEQLPLSSYKSLSTEQQEELLNKLIKEADWTDLLVLDYTIARIEQEMIEKTIAQEEMLVTKPASTIDIKTLLRK